MNRLLQISFDTLLTSVTPILSWFLLGILVDKNLINIFSLIYPMQFVISAIKSIFGTGANISAIRDKNKESIFSGIILGSIFGMIILGAIALNIDKYIAFMNMDIQIYKTFALYGLIQMFLQLLLNLSLCKLYYENDNKRANKYSFCFNLINFSSLIIMSIITKKQIIIASISVIITAIFTIVMMTRLVQKTKIKINIVNCVKYDSVYLFADISMFIIYLFGFKNSFDFGEKYILATSFATLITDTQWDISNAIKTVAQIDIAKREFSYKEHMKNSRKLIYLLIISTFIMGLILYPSYKVDITATLVIVAIELISLYMYPMYVTKLTYIQLEYSAIKATISKQIANILRICCSFIASPFCTSIGLAVSVIYQLVSTQYIIHKNKLNLEINQKNL
ncbi:MAG: hypothetical protein HFJ55_05195 [Clostridia bacterium]|nr:hypothetical protein [Clostridia bacterium]